MPRDLDITWDISTGETTYGRTVANYVKRGETLTISVSIESNGATSTSIPANAVATLKQVNTYGTVLCQWTGFAQVGATNVFTASATVNSAAVTTLLGTTTETVNCVFDFAGDGVNESDTIAVVLKNNVTRDNDTAPNALMTRNDFIVTNGTGLLVDVGAGILSTGASVAAQTSIALSNNATNYIELNSAGVASKNIIGFTDAYSPLAVVVTVSGAITTNTDRRPWIDTKGGGGITDGDKGDVTVSSGGAVWTIDSGVVTLAKMANIDASAGVKVIGRSTGSDGAPELISATSAATASTIALRDANANLSANGFIPGFGTWTATTLAILVGSSGTQYFTGVSATVVTLPTTSVVAGQSWRFINNSPTAAAVITINSSGGNLVQKIGIGQEATVTALQATPTTAAHWKASFVQHSFSAYLASILNNTSPVAGVARFLTGLTASIDTAAAWTSTTLSLTNCTFTTGSYDMVVDGAGATSPPAGLVVGMPLTGHASLGVGAYVTVIGSTVASRTTLTVNRAAAGNATNVSLSATRQYFTAPVSGRVRVSAKAHFGDPSTGDLGNAATYYLVDGTPYSLGHQHLFAYASGYDNDESSIGGTDLISVTEGQKIEMGIAIPALSWPIRASEGELSAGRATTLEITYQQ